MAHYNDSRLPIRSSTRDVSECQRPPPQKYASSLRIPEDTSWPKIPERKLHDNFNNAKGPYVVAFTGKASKNQIVQLPHSQFIKAAPRNDGTERNISSNTTAAFRTTTDRPATDPRFKTTVATTDTLKNEQNISNEESRNDVGKSDDNDNKIWQADSSIGYEQNICEKFETESKGDVVKSAQPIGNNQGVDVILEKSENAAQIATQRNAHPTIFSSFKTEITHATKNNSTLKKEESGMSNKSSSSTRKTQEITDRRRISRKLRPSQQLQPDATTTDSEVQSSANRIGQLRLSSRKIRNCQPSEDDTTDTTTTCDVKFNEYRAATRNCCYRSTPGKYFPRRDDNHCCFCIRCRKFWPTSKLALHSDPQMGSSKNRRCSTPYCCTKNLQRAASETDCTSIKSYRARRHERNNQSCDDFLSYSDALKVLLTKDGQNTDQVATRARKLLERNFFNNDNFEMKKMMQRGDNEEFRYACQLAMGAPQMKKRKSDIGDNLIAGFVNDGRYLERVTRDPSLTVATATNPLGDKQVDSQRKLKTAGIIAHRRVMLLPLYVILVLSVILILPTVYDYFFYEEEVEEPSYLEIIVDYVISSFQEAFGGLFEVIAKVFFQSRTCRKCSSNANN